MTEWTDDMVTTAKDMWAAGHSASQISRKIGGVTRNAVVGKLHRLGVGGGRKTPSRPVKKPPILKMPKPPRSNVPRAPAPKPPRVEAKPLPPETPRDPGAPVIRLEDLENHHCKYPIGDPQAPDFGFCGQPRLEGRVYCAEHCRVAYAPQSASKRKNAQFAYVERK